MKTKIFLKTLLVAACLLVGSNGAWGAKSVVGSLDNTTNWWSAFSDYYTLAANESKTVTFTNYSSNGFTYHNWLLIVANDVDRGGDGYAEYLALRADGHKWGDAAAAGTYTCSEGIGMPCDNTAGTDAGHVGYTTLMDILDGSNVILKVSRSGATVTIRADFTTTSGTSYYQQEVITAGDGTQDIRFFLTTEKGHIENLTEGAWNNVQTLDFESADTYKTGWSILAGSNTPSQIDHKAGKAMQVEADSKGSRDYYYNFATNTGFTTAPIWKIELDFAGSTANTDPTRFYIYSAASGNSYGQFTDITKFFDITDGAKYTTTAKVYAGNDTETSLANLTFSSYKTAISTWYHITLTGNSVDNSVKLSIRDASDAVVLAETKVCDFVNAKGMSIRAGKGLGKIAIDDVKAYKLVNPSVTTKYELSDGTTLIDDVETEVVAGNSFTPSYPASFQSGTKQYTYASGGDQIASVTADQTVTIVYNESDMPEGTFYAETYEKRGGTTGWSTATAGRFTPAVLGSNTNKYLSVVQSSRGQNSTTVTGTAWNGSVAKNTDFTMTFDLQLTNSNTDIPSLTFKDYDNSNTMLKLQPTAKNVTTWIINDNADQTVTLAADTWYSFSYSRKGELTYLTITRTSDDSEVLEQSLISTLSDNGGLGNVSFNTGRYYANIAFDNVLIRSWKTGDTPAVVVTSYTVKYQDALGNDLKDADVIATTAGTEDITATSGQMAPFYNDGKTKKYIYVSGNTTITADEDPEENVITLVFREADTYNYTVTNNLGTAIVAAASDFEGETIKVPFPRYELKDGTLYTKSAISNEYNYTFTLSSDNQAETITGYTDSNVPAVVFYTEGEDIDGVTESTAGATTTRASHSLAATRGDADRIVYEDLAPGIYKIHAGFFKASTAGVSATMTVDGQDILLSSGDGTNLVTTDSEEFTVTSTSDVVWTAGGAAIDYLYIQRVKVAKTISSAGWATYCSPYALDFSGVEGLEAYVITGYESDPVLSLYGIDDAPANVGVILKGAAGTYSIPVIASSSTDVSGNKLTGVTTATTLDLDDDDDDVADDYIYVLMDGGNGVGFYKTKATSFNLGANTAYLPADFADGLAREFFLFEDDGTTTGIADVRSKMSDVRGDVFDLQGRKVAQPAKGLYIVNGKKVVIK